MKKIALFLKPAVVICVLMLFAIKIYGGNYDNFVVRFVDAQTGKPISGAEVVFTKDGQRVEASTNKSGYVTIWDFPFTEEDNQNRLINLEVKKEGYKILSKTGVKIFQRKFALYKDIEGGGGGKDRGEGGDIPLETKWSIVLEWAARPNDLDAHLWFMDKSEHIYYENKKSDFDANLDYDGKYGNEFETITINRRRPKTNYYYSVHDYSHSLFKRTRKFSKLSDATVAIYIAGKQKPLKTFLIPKGKSGNKWDVFSVDKEGKIIEINHVLPANSYHSKKILPPFLEKS